MVWLGGWTGRGSKGKALPLASDLGFDISLGGRMAKVVEASAVRELRESDLAMLATERGIKPSHIQRLTDRHHALARCIATGMSAEEAGLCTAYTPSRISILKGDPAFEELVAFYRGDKGAQVQDLGEKLLSITRDAADVMQSRLEDTPEAFTVGELTDLLKTGADRTGFGPKATTVNVNVNLGDRLKSARERAAQASPPQAATALPRGASGHAGSLAPLLIEGTVNK